VELLMKIAMSSLALVLAACAPEVITGTYLCGPDAMCPDGQVCSGDNVCVRPQLAEPFTCQPDVASEPDDDPAQAYQVTLGCSGAGLALDGCMLEDDSADWIKFVAPTSCPSGIAVDARVTFPIAFERLELELRDLDSGTVIASDMQCRSGGGEVGHDIRCLEATLTPGTTYGIGVRPSGVGDCGGECAYNRYTLRVQLVTPR
jgi:hypothetical protein